ncbi:MAG: sulfur carrier protein ThiS [Acidobacteria bacterium]|nr:sulfur carrier protein ThiS [Acidobacteriota bacterium]MBI3658827.1 sulfur carrier protein ThiS [Acidobacteriota bacterium]
MIEVLLNGKSFTTMPNSTIRALLEKLPLGTDHIAVELNNTLIKRKDWERILLKPGDKVEVVRLVGGG